jgi:hypothetical protein
MTYVKYRDLPDPKTRYVMSTIVDIWKGGSGWIEAEFTIDKAINGHSASSGSTLNLIPRFVDQVVAWGLLNKFVWQVAT